MTYYLTAYLGISTATIIIIGLYLLFTGQLPPPPPPPTLPPSPSSSQLPSLTIQQVRARNSTPASSSPSLRRSHGPY